MIDSLSVQKMFCFILLYSRMQKQHNLVSDWHYLISTFYLCYLIILALFVFCTNMNKKQRFPQISVQYFPHIVCVFREGKGQISVPVSYQHLLIIIFDWLWDYHPVPAKVHVYDNCCGCCFVVLALSSQSYRREEG